MFQQVKNIIPLIKLALVVVSAQPRPLFWFRLQTSSRSNQGRPGLKSVGIQMQLQKGFFPIVHWLAGMVH